MSEPLVCDEHPANPQGACDQCEIVSLKNALTAATLRAERAEQERDELQKEALWVREMLGLLPDTPWLGTGKDGKSLAGAIHTVNAHAHGYVTYIEAFKCDDKQGQIARLTVRLQEAESTRASLLPYVQHKSDCETFSQTAQNLEYFRGIPINCTCGLAALLATPDPQKETP